MTFTCEDLDELTLIVVQAWRSGLDRDWSAPAGGLEWSCLAAAEHAVDTVFAPAFFLNSRKLDGYPGYDLFAPGPQVSPELLIEALPAATRMLTTVVRAAEPDTRAVIWLHPLEARGPEDFVPRGGLELILHAHDVCTGLGIAFDPPEQLCQRLRDHTAGWPMWGSEGGWRPPAMTEPAWLDLLRASGRA